MKESMLTFDRADIQSSKRTYTEEGYLRVPARIARTGTQMYRHDFLPSLNKAPGEQVKVFRPKEAVFDANSLSTFGLKPVTNGHPPVLVDSKTVKAYQVGTVADDAKQDGDYVTATLIVMDEQAIKDIEAGKCEVSVGYECDYNLEGGYTADGESYDAMQSNIICNHVAIVERGRAGSACRVFDSADETKHGEDMKKITFDGMTIDVTEQGEQAIAKLTSKLETAKAEAVTAKASFDAKEAEMQATLDSKEQELKEVMAKITTDADLDAMVEERATLVDNAKLLCKDIETAGKSNAQIVESVVVATCDGIDLEGKDESFKAIYCKARFDAALAVAKAGDGSDKMKVTTDMEDKDEKSEDEKARDKFMGKGE